MIFLSIAAAVVLGSAAQPDVEHGGYKTILLAEHLVPNQQPYDSTSKLKSIRDVLRQYGREADDEAEQMKSIRDVLLQYGREADDEAEQMKTNEKEVHGSRAHVGQKTPVLGSSNDLVHTNGNYGFFSAVFESYNNHWTLRTSPEDWWYSIIHRIALAIDRHSTNEAVREFFVSHGGKKTLEVQTGPMNVDYVFFLDQMTQQIGENMKVPKYLDILKSDFSTSTDLHIICSEITIMASVQEYFQFRLVAMCGIPAVEMEGTLEDWKHLKKKFNRLRAVLMPIHKYVGLEEIWWDNVSGVFDHLIITFKGKPNTDWWSKIISKEPFGSGEQIKYEGWFITEFLGRRGTTYLEDLQNGVITVPMTITNCTWGDSCYEEQSAFAAGIAGYNVIEVEGSKWPSVKAAHGWTLMMDPDSEFRKDFSSGN